MLVFVINLKILVVKVNSIDVNKFLINEKSYYYVLNY